MKMPADRKIVLIRRKTRLEELIARYNTASQAKFYMEHLGADFSDYAKEHEQYNMAITEAINLLGTMARVQVVDRSFLPNFIFGREDLVVAIGQDGLVANTMKYLTEQCILGVNPDPGRWDGVLLPFKVNDLKHIIPEALKNQRHLKEVTMAKAILNDGQEMYCVNDFFIGQKTHVSARYQISIGSSSEQHSSSGVIVSTGLGSTGWLRSVLTGAANIVGSFSNSSIDMNETQIKWDSDYLYFSVREPFPSKTTQAGLVFGKITGSMPLKILSRMPENGVIFSDGIENDFLSFNSGIEATITIAEKRGHLVV